MGLQICHIATPQDTRAILLQIDPRETRIQNNRRERLQWRNKANDRLPPPERCPENEHPRTIWRYCKKYLMDSHASLHPSQSRLTYLLPWLALIVFLAITYLPWKNEQQIVVKELQTGFDFRVRNAEYLVGQRIKIYEQVLNGVEGLFSHARVVKRNEFRNYVAKLNLMNDYPGIQGLGFALIVPKADKDRHIASIRKQGFPEYTIKPDGERDIYTPIVYIEPYSERNQRNFRRARCNRLFTALTDKCRVWLISSSENSYQYRKIIAARSCGFNSANIR